MTRLLALLNSSTALGFASAPPVYNGPTAGQVAQTRAANQNRGISSSVGDPFLARSKDSAAMLPYWDRVDAIVDGIDAMRAAGDDFLPKFADEDEPDYKFRLKCTKLTNVYRDTIEGLASKPFEREVQLVDGTNGAQAVPPQIKDFVYDVDGSGNNLTIFSSATMFNAINSAIDWIAVEYDEADASIVTQADAKRAGRRPYWSHILGRNIIDVKSAIIGGKETLTYIKIYEPGDVDHVREYVRAADGVVTWTLYEHQPNAVRLPNETSFVAVKSGTISIGVIPLVPFYTGRRDGSSWRFLPAMKDAADLQVELYQQESGLKHAKTLTAYPMLAANGISPPMGADGKPITKLAVGPGRVLWSKINGDGKYGSWAYVEPNAESLKFLADDIGTTIQQLRELGRQPLTAQSGNITVITAAVAAGKARSAVRAWAIKMKDTLENCLVLTAKWLGIAYDPSVDVFLDFDDFMEGEDVDALLAMREKGDMSQETLWEEMHRRGVLSSNFTKEREQKRLLDELPVDGPDTVEE